MKFKRRILPFILAMIMVMAMLPMNALAFGNGLQQFDFTSGIIANELEENAESAQSIIKEAAAAVDYHSVFIKTITATPLYVDAYGDIYLGDESSYASTSLKESMFSLTIPLAKRNYYKSLYLSYGLVQYGWEVSIVFDVEAENPRTITHGFNGVQDTTQSISAGRYTYTYYMHSPDSMDRWGGYLTALYNQQYLNTSFQASVYLGN